MANLSDIKMNSNDLVVFCRTCDFRVLQGQVFLSAELETCSENWGLSAGFVRLMQYTASSCIKLGHDLVLKPNATTNSSHSGLVSSLHTWEIYRTMVRKSCGLYRLLFLWSIILSSIPPFNIVMWLFIKKKIRRATLPPSICQKNVGNSVVCAHRVIEDVDAFPVQCCPCVHEELLFVVSHGVLRFSVPTVE